MTRRISDRVALGVAASTGIAFLVFGLVAWAIEVHEEEAEVTEGSAPASEDVVRDALVEVAGGIAVAGPVGLGLAVLAAFLITRRALAPIDRLVASAATISEPSRRLPLPERDDEIRQLAVSLNEVFERQQAGWEALDRFAADASHELRTPLATLAAELEIALRRPRSPEEWERVAQSALTETRRLNGLVDALLRLARAGATRHPAQSTSRVDLRELASGVLGAYAAQATSAGVTLCGPEGTEPVHVTSADPTTLASALSNLVGNALSHAPRHSVVRVSCEHEGGAAVLHVDDAGPGLALDATPFTAFWRGENSDHGGVGLGLAIARRIAEVHGGSLVSDRSPAGGARFTLRLPSPVATT